MLLCGGGNRRTQKQSTKNTKGEEMNKTRIISMIVLLVGAIILTACGGQQDSGIPTFECLGSSEDALVDLECQEITVAVENAYLPFNYISSETGEAGGWDYEVIPEICARLHCQPVFQEVSWDVMIQSVADGLYSMAADGITIKDDRKEIVDFSMGYMNVEQRLLVRIGEERFTSIEDFAADDTLIMGTQTATTNYDSAVEYIPEERISGFEQFPFAIQALISGDVDAVIIDGPAGLGYKGENADTLDMIGPSISSDTLGLAFAKGSDLVEPFNAALQAMMDDGFMDQVNTKFWGDFAITYDDIEEITYDD
jgi:polar amino acid transport system substrate-binding protein